MDANKFVCKVYSPDFLWTFSFKLSCAIMLSLGLVAFWADSLNTFRLSEVTAKAVIASVVPAMTALREDHNNEGAGPERVLRDRRVMVRETLENERANMVSGGLRVLVIDRTVVDLRSKVLIYLFSIDRWITSHRRLFILRAWSSVSESRDFIVSPAGLAE